MRSAERLTIRVHYDLASALCYVAHRVVERLAPDLEELAIDLEWSPLDLARLLGWRRGESVPEARLSNAERVARELEVPIRVPRRWLDSRRGLAIALALGAGPREATWRERLFTAAFEEGRDIGAAEEITRFATDLDLDPGDDAIEAGLIELESRTLAAGEEMVSGAPTFMLDQWPFGGIQEESTMRSVLRRWAARKRRHGRDEAGSPA